MKIFFKSILLVLLVVNLLQANEDNNNSISHTRTWHYALSIGSTINLFTEKSFEGHSAMLIDIEIEPNNGEIISSGFNTAYMYYNDKDAYMFEGLYYKAGIGVYETTYISGFEDINLETSAGIGYGWHFFNHILLSLDTGVKYSYYYWDSQDVSYGHVSAGSDGVSDYYAKIYLGLVF